MGQCPFHPNPVKNKAGLFFTFFKKRRSWLDGLYERSYKMKMGRVKMPGLDLYVVNDPKEVKKIMVDKVREFPKSELLHELLKPLLGESIFTTNADTWQKQRDMLDPSFSNMRISKVFTLMSEAVDDLMIQLNTYPQNEVINMDTEMTFVTADIIFRTILSEKLDRNDALKVINAFTVFQEETANTAMRTMFKIPQWISYFFGEKKRIKAGEEIRQILTNIIKPRYDAVTNSSVGDENDILSTLLQVVDADTNERFTFEEILDQVAMLFLAGHETTASSLTWALYLLSLYPEHQERAFDEIWKISKDEKITATDVKKMKHTNNIFKETLRLYPPVGFFVRESKLNTKIRDKDIKKGVSVVVAPWLIHRHKDFWDNPNGFNPDRYLDPKSIKKDSYIPFGMGERVCIGAGFAMQESILILASIIRKYTLKLEDGFVPDIVGRLTIRSVNGMSIILQLRDKN